MNLIVARGISNEIGEGNRLLWRLTSDLEHFKNMTKGNTVVMGRKTWESIGEKPLKDRTNVVITSKRNEVEVINGQLVHFLSVQHFHEAFLAQFYDKYLHGEIFIIGGAQIYEEFANHVNVMYITEVERSYPNADSYFTFPSGNWSAEIISSGLDNGLYYEIRKHERV